jgi:hypothetical protein
VEHRSAIVARIVLVAVMVVSIAFIATDGFGRFDPTVDVLLIGDSIMAQSGPFVREQLDAVPGVGSAKVHLDATSGSGLLTPGFVDWQRRAADLVDRYRPKIVVVLFVGNYTDKPEEQWVDANGQRIPNDYGPAFFAAWQGEAEKLTRTVGRYGAQVDWVQPPPMLTAELHRREEAMRATYEAVQRAIPSVVLIDARPALGGPDRGWVAEKPNVDGVVAPIRAPDTVHLTVDGARLLARQMAATVGPQLIDERRGSTA